MKESEAKQHVNALQRKVAKALVGFSADIPKGTKFEGLNRFRPEASEFPLPELVLFTLRNVLGCRNAGPEEKVAWSVQCLFNGTPISFEHQKFGFTIMYPDGVDLDFKRICGQLKTAIKHAEKALGPLALEQANRGNVTIANRFSGFDRRYRFFRGKADAAYRKAARKVRAPPKAARNKAEDKLGFGLDHALKAINAQTRAKHEGFYFSAAMVDAYFSRLEHQLVLMLAFQGRPLAEGELIAFLSAGWDVKIKRFLDVAANRRAEIAYAKLKRIKERIRNPFAHGGVENDRGSLNVHIPSIGALPANFTRIRDSVTFNFIPIEADDHQSAYAVFDEIDRLLADGPLAPVFRFVDEGVDPQFDARSLKDYAELVSGPSADLDGYINYWHEEWSRRANMD